MPVCHILVPIVNIRISLVLIAWKENSILYRLCIIPVCPQAHHYFFNSYSIFPASVIYIWLFPFLHSFACSCNISACLLPLPVAYLCLLSLCRPAVFWPQSERIVGYGWRQTTGSRSRSSRQCHSPQVLYNIGTCHRFFFCPLVFSASYVTTHSYVQVSQHSADQHESVLSATLH